MELHQPGAAFQPTVALKRAVVTTMAPNTQEQSRRGKAPRRRSLRIPRPGTTLGNKIVPRDDHLSQAPVEERCVVSVRCVSGDDVMNVMNVMNVMKL